MRVVFFCHSVLSDWNNGNAHFQRGVVAELLRRGHRVTVFEPSDAWSVENLIADTGVERVSDFHAHYPGFDVRRYAPAELDLEVALAGAELVIVHEWSAPELVRAIGRHRASGGGYQLLFHDTHHRMVTAPHEMQRFEFDGYDAVLGFGAALAQRYAASGWGSRAFVWHEAADVRVFRPLSGQQRERDLVWVGNWGDEERSRELSEFLLEPVRALGLSSHVHGVRYPEHARRALARAGIEYRGWLSNFEVPRAFAAARVTVHVPRRPYAAALPGIPTIRPFEALACGIPLISAPWDDSEGLFSAGRDYLVARDGPEMRRLLREVLADPARAHELAEQGRRTILARHTVAHRTDELLAILARLARGSALERRLQRRADAPAGERSPA